MNGPQPIITVRKLSKRYRIGPDSTSVADIWRGFGRSLVRRFGSKNEAEATDRHIWALRDINIDVMEGERVGIIGRNGAGKSTLLKILSRVAYPTKGEARLRGRVTSLLEVGTGFSDELTGRENIFLNASLYGLDRSEIESRLEEIIDFSEIRRFIDTPVKHYSSGMRMRLAFSVAAHLEPDILMLDEVLAVGDLSFQQKCLGRMEDMTGRGRTLLFVSHSMDAIARFCDRCIWLEGGRLAADGPVTDITAEYVAKILEVRSSLEKTAQPGGAASGSLPEHPRPADNDQSETATESAPSNFAPSSSPGIEEPNVELLECRTIDEAGTTISVAALHSRVGVEFTYRTDRASLIVPSFALLDKNANVVFWSVPPEPDPSVFQVEAGDHLWTAWIPENLLNVGQYFITVAIVGPDATPMRRYVLLERAISFYMIETPTIGRVSRGILPRDFPGAIRPLLNWTRSADH